MPTTEQKREYARWYRATYPEKARASKKCSLEANKEKVSERRRAYRLAHPLTVQQRARKNELLKLRRAANPEKFSAAAKLFRERHPKGLNQKRYREKNLELCRARTREAMRIWRETHRAEDAARTGKYRAANPAKARRASALANKRWRESHPEDRVIRDKEHNARWAAKPENLVKKRAATANWEKLHPEKKAKRRAAKLNATPAWANNEIMQLIYAEAAHRKLDVDHIVPLQGKNVCGLHVYYNTQLLTRSQNSSKHNKTMFLVPVQPGQ